MKNMIYRYKNKKPSIHETCFVAPSADIIGDVEIGENSSVWFNSTIRGDQSRILIGKNVSVQDNAVVHVAPGYETKISDDVVIGHNAIVHGCVIGRNCIIGMGSIILSGAEIGENCIIGAGSVITENKKIPKNSIVMGVPGKIVKEVTKEHIKRIKENVEIYIKENKEYKTNF
ncbi:MAG TPA: gamma carbonic anhydrase family protein [Candidatus Bilamarchaeaceae archaeon]|nr:gamma carbonic anhydrase family protein [Candidatus Bilamarchaeaceae archaeon]